MRAYIFLALFVSTALHGISQTSAPADPMLPKDPRAILEAAAPFYDFADPALKPWHLKATYQLYDEKGAPTEQGTYEYWWASPKVYRSTWTRAGATRTDWHTADGAMHRDQTGKPLRHFERTLETTLLAPLPQRTDLDSGRLKLELRMIQLGQATLACVTSALQFEVNGKLQAQSEDTPEVYCFDPTTLALRLTNSSSVNAEYDQVIKTYGHYLARQVDVTIGNQKVFSVSVEAVNLIDPSDTAFSPATDAGLVPAAVNQTTDGQPGSSVTYGKLVKKTQPYYPPGAKAARIQGVMVLGAVIGADGKVHDLEALASPSPLLTESALDCVKRWEYKPYMLDGVPVEVDTVVNVIFNLGG